jgi:hypothetical protein
LRNSSGTLIGANNDWMDDPTQKALIIAAGLAPTNNLESAIYATLAPGQYTVLLSGVSNGTGVGLVEAYDLAASGGPSPSPGGTPTPTATVGGTPTPTPGSTPTPTATVGGTPTPTPGSTPSPTPGTCTENFDGVTAPALPAGWVASNPIPGDGDMWVTSNVTPDSAPNDAFIPDQDGVSDKVLDRAGIVVQSSSAILTFRNNFNTEMIEVFGDGGVLEVSTPSIRDGDFLDITDPQVGGTFVSGGYTGAISGGRLAWIGDSGGYIDTVINLGPNLARQTVTLRWRFISDVAIGAPGWRIDNLSIDGASCP